jgi:CheY-like chemotaxis protein
MRPKRVEDVTPTLERPVDPGRTKIVVVDDEPAMCGVIEGMLMEAGYDTAVTCDPREALELIRRAKPALVLADISMPHMDGYAVLDAIRGDPEVRACPVMFITGNLAFSERMHAFRRGVRDYVAKPFTAEKLLAKVAKVLNDGGPPEPA